ncbi:translocation/assembly module TamB domain-containing protein [Ichthyenterobacterium sp. W332]|uniref:Translocation/assembly module TamB domain-containing protein n=1 Tax=Microcosmobacter mediterraneus TaxID=3075607 RepID=A0ABU2YLZ8_9FLAO|nr:translocation/assembly module TamB domain-containing protein [Ichthyenterobacterium sp. W332]MDT0559178.1 translocation/assembly module TamB domain-containing protein [Ichthyenterobacterium sp. W332]
MRIKKVLKITSKIIGIILLLFVILVLVLSIPSVQTKLGKYATKRLNEDFGTNINIGKVGLQFNGDVELKGIYIEDYKKDTLIAIQELNTSIISFKKLYDGKLNFGDVDIEGLLLNIKTYKGAEDTNLDIFVARFDEDEPTDEPSGFLLSTSDISIYDSEFRLSDENKEKMEILEFTDLNINATNFLINGPDVSARINRLSFLDRRGLRVKNMITDFTYSRSQMNFQNLNVKTEKSNLNGSISFDYKREDLKDFTDKVNVTANFSDSSVQLDDLNVFYNEFGANQNAKLSVHLSGTLNNLKADKLQLNSGNQTKIYGDILFINLFNSEANNFSMDGRFRNLSSNYYDLRALLPNILGESIPSIFAKLGSFKITGDSYITDSTIDADINIDTELGFIDSDLQMTKIDDIDNADYKGTLLFREFDLGPIANDEKVGKTSFDLEVDGKGFTLETLDTKITGEVFELAYNNYLYRNINVEGKLGDRVFDGILIADDNNLKLNFNGLVDFSNDIKTYDFKAEVALANLKTLNFVTRDSVSVFRGKVDMSMKGSSIEDAIGVVNVKNTIYKNQDENYFFQDFTVTSDFTDKDRIVTINSPDIISGFIKGNFKFDDIQKLTENSIGSIFTNYSPHDLEDNQYLDFDFKIYSKIVTVFFKDLKLSENTTIKGRIETDAKRFKLSFDAPQVNFRDYFAEEITMNVDNSNPVYNTYIAMDSIGSKHYNISDFNFINRTVRDTLFVNSEFKGGKFNDDTFDLNLFYTINEDNKFVVGFKRSDIQFKGYDWQINSNRNKLNKVTFDKDLKDFYIDDLVMSHYDEDMTLSGEIIGNTNKNLNLDFNDIDLVKITPPIDSLALAGSINGNIKLLQREGNYVPSSDINIENLELNRYNLGNLKAKLSGQQSLTNYLVDITLENDGLTTLNAQGDINFDAKRPSVNVAVDFEEFLLDPLNPLGEGVINNIRGVVSGNADITGNLNRPDINGQLLLDRAGLSIPYLNVDYSFDFDSKVNLRKQEFVFDNVVMTDSEYFSRGLLNGNISHNNLSDWELGLELSTERMLVLSTDETEDALYYGTGFVSGKADIFGPTDQLKIEFEGATEKGTVFNIPLNDSESFGDNSYIHFLSPEEKVARYKGEVVRETEIKGLELFFDLNVNQNAEIEIVIDKNSGSTIKGKGEGNLLFDINTNGKFNMYGTFAVFQGSYNFRYGALVQKEFQVKPGGTIDWEGEPFDALINLQAIYTTNTNPSVLLDNPINRSIPVELQINLTGELEQPEPDFTFNFPNVNSTIKSELNYRLTSKEDRDNQALYLLTTGSFARGLDDLNLSGTIAERLNGIIGNILGDQDDQLKLGVNYEIGQNSPDVQTDDRVGLTLETKISEKVVINGKVGVPIGGATQSVIAGDVQIDWLLNDDGTLRAQFFNRENTIRNFGEEIGYTQGIGLSYNVEFDTFRELIQIIFSGKNKTKEKQKEKPKENTKESDFPDFINVKKKDSTSQN